MTKFLYHEPCPSCGSKNNLGVWEDGHKWCFGCKYYEAGELNIKHVHDKCPVLTKDPRVFPEDAEYYIPTEPMRWLIQNGINYSTQKHFGIQWSKSQQLVCWKIGTLGWQGRCFAKNAKTKYIGHGKIHEKPFILWNTNLFPNTIVLVEDYISAIRVNTYLPCMPLFGCTINLELLQSLSKRFTKVLIWLDADKLDNARRIAQNASMVGLETGVIFTPKDPKAYSDDEINTFLQKTTKEKLNGSY